MFTPGISSTRETLASRMMAGSGIEAIESRARQIEGMIRAMEGGAKVKQPFKAYLQGPDGLPGGEAAPDATTRLNLSGNLQARFQALQPLVEKYSAKHGVDKDLVNAVIRQESGFNPTAVSSAGAQGLMQLMPATAQGLGVTQPTDPAQNLDGGIRHLKGLLEHFHGNIPLALAAYNAGLGAVKKHKGLPPYRETQNYVRNILAGFLAQKQQSQS